LPFSENKNIPRNSEQVGTDGRSVGIPPVLRKRKTSEFHSEPFLGREKPSEFCSEPFLGRETPSEFLSEPFIGREKPSEFRSEPFLGRENSSEFRSESFSEEKKLGKKTTFVSCFVKLQYFAEFPSVPFRYELWNGLFRNTGNYTE
jgi:hypothetical protein